MGKSYKTEGIVLLFENYLQDSRKLHTSFKLAGKSYPVVVIDDDGFLPNKVESVYGYFLGEFKKGNNIPGKPRYFNQIVVPEYWEISGNNSGGKIHDLNKERGRIFYTAPTHKRLVKTVDWYDERGIVRSSDHYNKYGALYARTTFNSNGERITKSYFSAAGAEIIVENYVTKDIILNDDDVVRIFKNKTEFVCFFLERKGYSSSRLFYNTLATPFFVSQALYSKESHRKDILFWQERARADIPGNMKFILEQKNTSTVAIKVLDKTAYDKFVSLGADKSIMHRLGYIYDFKKKNNHKPEALICTNSDRIARCEEIIKEIPEMNFNIVAITEMSSRLTTLEKYSNVTLYPAVKMKMLDSIFEKCDFYLDINYENEIVSAVQTAFIYNHLIVAFKETCHNKNYVSNEHMYSCEDYKCMINDLKSFLNDREKADNHIHMQHIGADLEDARIYDEL